MQLIKQILCILAAIALSLGGCVGFGTDQDLDAALDSQATSAPPRPRSDYQPAHPRQPRAESARPFEAGGLNRQRANSFDPFEQPPPAATSARPRKSPAPGESPLVTQKSPRPETDVKTVAHHEAVEDKPDDKTTDDKITDDKIIDHRIIDHRIIDREIADVAKADEAKLDEAKLDEAETDKAKAKSDEAKSDEKKSVDDQDGDKATDDKAVVEPIPAGWDDRLRLAIEALEKRLEQLSDSKTQAAERAKLEAQLRLLYFVANDRDNALKPIDSFSGAEREYWKELVFSLIVYFDDEQTPLDVQRRTLALHNFKRAADLLSTVSNLEVRNVRFCTRVDSFGRYTEVSNKEFLPGAEVLLYVEVDNFEAEQIKQDGEYETALLGSYEIFDIAGQRVEHRTFVVEKEICRNRRRDFFIPYRIYMPDTQPGQYNLQLTIKDVKSQRSGQSAPISFAIKR